MSVSLLVTGLSDALIGIFAESTKQNFIKALFSLFPELSAISAAESIRSRISKELTLPSTDSRVKLVLPYLGATSGFLFYEAEDLLIESAAKGIRILDKIGHDGGCAFLIGIKSTIGQENYLWVYSSDARYTTPASCSGFTVYMTRWTQGYKFTNEFVARMEQLDALSRYLNRHAKPYLKL